MLEVGRGDDDGIEIFQRQHVFEVLEGAGRAGPGLRGGLSGAFPVHFPEIADGRHFDVPGALEAGRNGCQFPAPVPDSDLPQRDPVVCAQDAAVGYRGTAERGATHTKEPPALQLVCVWNLHTDLSAELLLPEPVPGGDAECLQVRRELG
jgi:hypothetical protein